MNLKNSSLLGKAIFFLGAITIGLASQAQAQGQTQGMPHRWGHRNGGDSAQRQQIAAINKEYRQKSADLFKKDNITLREYKAGLLALQKEKKVKIEALLTPEQKEKMAARHKKMAENQQVMAAARMERLKVRLNLSDDQVAKIKAGQESLRSEAKAIHENDNLLPQEKMEQMKALMAKRNDTYKAVLTPEQYSQYEKMSQHRGRFGRRGFGEHGGFRDRGGLGDGGGSAERV